MAQGGFQVAPEELRAGSRRLLELSEDVGDSAREPLVPVAGGNGGFAAFQALAAAADAWEAEVSELSTALLVAGDKMQDTAADYERAEDSAEFGFKRIMHGG